MSEKSDLKCLSGIRRQPLKLHDRLVENVNSYGAVEYNIPLRTSGFEKRTSTSVYHRHFPDLPAGDSRIGPKPLPDRLRHNYVLGSDYYRPISRTCYTGKQPDTREDTALKPVPYRRIDFLTDMEKRMQRTRIIQPVWKSETRDSYRGIPKPRSAPQEEPNVKPMDEHFCNVVADGRNKELVIPETSQGFRKLLDPYLTTHRNTYKPFTVHEQLGIGAKDQISYYTENNCPRIRGFGPRIKEIYAPLSSKAKEPIYDKVLLKKEFKEKAAARNIVGQVFLKGRYVSETKMKYKPPYTVATEDQVTSKVVDIPPSPWQANTAPFMYCSDYCHISQGTSPCLVIKMLNKTLPPHKQCKKGFIVSHGYKQD